MAARNITLNKAVELSAAVIRMLKVRSANADRDWLYGFLCLGSVIEQRCQQ